MSQSQSHITAGGRPAYPPWCLAPPGAHDQSYYPLTGRQAYPPSWVIVLDCDCRRLYNLNLYMHVYIQCRSQWPRDLRFGSTAARLLRSWVRIPPGTWMFVCCVLSGRGICNELITRPEESYRLWHVVVCDQETSWTRRPQPALGCGARERYK
jgi:hypothetical protein